MKKKEIRWISRDIDYSLWMKKPKYNRKEGLFELNNRWDSYMKVCAGELESAVNLKLKRGGLAKITIERQY